MIVLHEHFIDVPFTRIITVCGDMVLFSFYLEEGNG